MHKKIINVKPQIKGIGKFTVAFLNISANETSGFRGVSHLCEHVMCEGLRHLEEDFLKDGLVYNAYTTSADIFFFITGLDDKLKTIKEKFISSLLNYKPTKDVFEREKKIILSEYQMSMSKQTEEFANNFCRKYLNLYSPLGILEDIKNISYDAFLEFYFKYFSKASQIVNYSNYKLDDEQYFINTYLSDKVLKEPKIKQSIYPGTTEHNVDYKTEIVYLVKFLDKSYYKKDLKKLMYWEIFSTYLSEGLNSPLVKDVREKYNIYYVSSSFTKIFNSLCYFDIAAMCSNTDRDVIKNAINDSLSKHLIDIDINRFNDIVSFLKSRKIQSSLIKDGSYYQNKYNCPINFKYNKLFINNEFSIDELKIILNNDFKNFKTFTEFSSTI